ncbi:hypothetical protein QAD02_011083 [Eretmocerus hayati]|uniref:Uncharacterized protein n=1 Tax=Eretmocerus hayati TaxID=131215 RepID=A0ACC2NYL5_9HYME|nr:hypothetical protein QAD02_011083 [Eretmocerus hayati]
MGCASSACADDQQSGSGLRLITSKLNFKDEQLEKLNDYFSELARADRAVSAESIRVEGRVERLVQRLVAGAGNLDRRFAAVFLVSLNEPRRVKQLRFEYVLRLDALSTPSGSSDAFTSELSLNVEEDSGGSVPGFIRLRLRSGDAGSWSEFIGSDGRLRRDLVKSRLATLLAAALRLDVMKNVDERSCITPGQVVEPDILDKILKQPEHCRIFYRAAEDDLNVEKSEHRVAIVEDEGGIVLKIGLDGSKSQDIQVRLLIGASINSWPTSLDYPKRIPLHHCDVLLHYTTAQTGMYAVTVAPHPGLRCEDRSSLWRVRLLAAETGLKEHYSRASIPALTEIVLLRIIDQLSGRLSADFALKRKGRLRLVSRHMLRAILWWSLERTGPDPLKSWAPDTLSQHVLLALDELLRALKCQNLRCYFQPRCNLMLQCVRGGVPHHDDAYTADARLVESYLSALHDYSSEWLREPSPLVPRNLSSSELLDAELISRWREVLASLPRGTMSNHNGYGQRQLQYLGLVVKEVLQAKESLNQDKPDTCRTFFNISTMDSQINESTENLIYLMSLVLQQAKDQVNVSSLGRRKKRNRRRSQAERKRSCAKAYFDKSVDLLLDVVRKDRETAYLDLENHTVMAKTLLKWLYFGMDEDKKVLKPLLRPYLGNLFNASHEYAWHVESWRKRHDMYASEIRSLSLFCKLASSREILPANGIVDALSRGWSWADGIARMIERSGNGLGLVFLTPERVLSKARSAGNALRRANIARNSMIVATDSLPCLCDDEDYHVRDVSDDKVAGHTELRESSPLTFVAAMARRRGRQRGPGGLIPALVSLNKFRVLEQIVMKRVFAGEYFI